MKNRIFILLLLFTNQLIAQKPWQLTMDVYSGYSKFKNYRKTYKDAFVVINDQIISAPANYTGIGFQFSKNNWTLGFDYMAQRYMFKSKSEKIFYKTNEVEYGDYSIYDNYFISKFKLGYELLNKGKWQNRLEFGYALPAFNSWGLKPHHTVFNHYGRKEFYAYSEMVRAGAFSLNVNIGYLFRSNKSRLALVMGVEWLRNDVKTMFYDIQSEETNRWYYSAGLRYSHVVKVGKKNKHD